MSNVYYEQTQNAREIAAAAQQLYARVSNFVGHFEDIRGGLERASKAYNDAVGSYERQVRPSGERLSELGAGVTGKELPPIEPIADTLRLPPATSV